MTRAEFKKIVILFIFWRIILFVASYLGTQLLPFRPDFEYTKLSYYTQLNPVEKAVEPWANFDGVHYLNIARRGYVDDGRFFPLLPFLLKGWGGELALSFILAQLIALAAICSIYRLLRMDFSEKTSLTSMIVLLLFPTSFFLGSIYTEGLFLLFSSLSIFAARKGHWWQASTWTFLLVVTRFVGIVLVPVLLFQWWQQNKDHVLAHSKTLLPIVFAPIGLAFFSWFNYQKWGDWLYFLHAHTELGNSRAYLVNPLRTAFRYMKILTSLSPNMHEWWVAILELSSFAFILILLFIAWKQKLAKTYALFCLLAFAIPVLSGTWTGLPRYVLVLFPLFTLIAQQKNRMILIAYAMVCIPILLLLTALFSRGYFIA
jgi:hypothetical protein